jgi:hypothetical protein
LIRKCIVTDYRLNANHNTVGLLLLVVFIVSEL